MENNNLFASYRFYNNRGERLSVYAKQIDDTDTMRIYVVRCSKKDQFIKRDARILINNFLSGSVLTGANLVAHPEVLDVPLNGNKVQKAMYQFCLENFYKLQTRTFYITGAIPKKFSAVTLKGKNLSVKTLVKN